MPVAYCYLSPDLAETIDFQSIVSAWAQAISVSESDITLNLVHVDKQYGQRYRVMVRLYLPTLWSADQVRHITEQLGVLIEKHIDIQPGELFIHAQFVESAHVYTDGKIEEWEER